MPLSSPIDLEIPKPATNRKITLHALLLGKVRWIRCAYFMSWSTSVVSVQLKGVLVSKKRWNLELHVIEKMKITSLSVQILHLLTCVCKKDYRLGIEMKKENPVGGSVEERQKERKIKGRSSIDAIQHLWYRLLNCNQRYLFLYEKQRLAFTRAITFTPANYIRFYYLHHSSWSALDTPVFSSAAMSCCWFSWFSYFGSASELFLAPYPWKSFQSGRPSRDDMGQTARRNNSLINGWNEYPWLRPFHPWMINLHELGAIYTNRHS